VARRGGAGLTLLAYAQPDFVARRFGRVVIGSGDGAFSDLARELQQRNLRVVCVARGNSLSMRLKRHVHQSLRLRVARRARQTRPSTVSRRGEPVADPDRRGSTGEPALTG
jgi:hypothetical protein